MTEIYSTSSALIPFQFDTHAIQVHMDDDGNPWWVLQDICAVLGLSNPSRAASRLKPSESTTLTFSYTGVTRQLLLVNEQGLYRLIMRSSKPDAARFQDWVFRDVLPQIRKTGKYEAPTTALTNPWDMLVQMAEAGRQQAQQLAVLEESRRDHDARLLLQQQATIAQQAQILESLQRSQSAEAKADTAVQNQNFWTIAEYVQYHQLRHQCPESAYVEASRHMQAYCKRERLNFRDPNILPRRIPVGDKNWETEWGFHTSVYEEAFLPWLLRRNSQRSLTIVESPA